MKTNIVYLDTYILQKDMRIRLPKSILENLNVKKGEAYFSIYLDKNDNCLILKPNYSEERKNHE